MAVAAAGCSTMQQVEPTEQALDGEVAVVISGRRYRFNRVDRR